MDLPLVWPAKDRPDVQALPTTQAKGGWQVTYEATVIRDEDGRARALSFSPMPGAVPAPSSALGDVATPGIAIPCEFCGATVPGTGRGTYPRRFCDARCRMAQWSKLHPRTPIGQALLDFTPPPVPLRPINAPPAGQGKRLKRSCAAVLARLEAGTATGLDLIRAGGGVRYGARVMELRRMGYRIEAAQEDAERGIWRYSLASA